VPAVYVLEITRRIFFVQLDVGNKSGTGVTPSSRSWLKIRFFRESPFNRLFERIHVVKTFAYI